MNLNKISNLSEPQLPHLYERDSNIWSFILPFRIVLETNRETFENTLSFRANFPPKFFIVFIGKSLWLVTGKGGTLAHPSLIFPIWHVSNVVGGEGMLLKNTKPSLRALNNKPKPIWPFSPHNSMRKGHFITQRKHSVTSVWVMIESKDVLFSVALCALSALAKAYYLSL